MSFVRVAATLFVLALTGCGRGEKEVPPAEWCRDTGVVIQLLDQYSTTRSTDELGLWEESAPEDIRSEVERMSAALRRYPVDAEATDLVASRTEVERFAKERCAEGWRVPKPPA